MNREYYPIDLPGKILYPIEFNAKIRKITPIEQKFILSLSQKQQKTNRDYINFIKQLVEFDDPTMTFEKLYWFDVQYILYRIRFITYNKHPIKLDFECDNEECTNTIAHTLDIGNMVILTPDDLKDVPNTLHLDNLGEVKIRNKIMQDDITIDIFAEQNNLDLTTDYHMRLLLLDLCLVSEDKPFDELYKLADSGTLTAEDIVKIEEWFKKSIWGVKEEVQVKCVCGKEASREYFLSLEDFFSVI